MNTDNNSMFPANYTNQYHDNKLIYSKSQQKFETKSDRITRLKSEGSGSFKAHMNTFFAGIGGLKAQVNKAKKHIIKEHRKSTATTSSKMNELAENLEGLKNANGYHDGKKNKKLTKLIEKIKDHCQPLQNDKPNTPLASAGRTSVGQVQTQQTSTRHAQTSIQQIVMQQPSALPASANPTSADVSQADQAIEIFNNSSNIQTAVAHIFYPPHVQFIDPPSTDASSQGPIASTIPPAIDLQRSIKDLTAKSSPRSSHQSMLNTVRRQALMEEFSKDGQFDAVSAQVAFMVMETKRNPTLPELVKLICLGDLLVEEQCVAKEQVLAFDSNLLTYKQEYALRASVLSHSATTSSDTMLQLTPDIREKIELYYCDKQGKLDPQLGLNALKSSFIVDSSLEGLESAIYLALVLKEYAQPGSVQAQEIDYELDNYYQYRKEKLTEQTVQPPTVLSSSNFNRVEAHQMLMSSSMTSTLEELEKLTQVGEQLLAVAQMPSLARNDISLMLQSITQSKASILQQPLPPAPISPQQSATTTPESQQFLTRSPSDTGVRINYAAGDFDLLQPIMEDFSPTDWLIKDQNPQTLRDMISLGANRGFATMNDFKQRQYARKTDLCRQALAIVNDSAANKQERLKALLGVTEFIKPASDFQKPESSSFGFQRVYNIYESDVLIINKLRQEAGYYPFTLRELKFISLKIELWELGDKKDPAQLQELIAELKQAQAAYQQYQNREDKQSIARPPFALLAAINNQIAELEQSQPGNAIRSTTFESKIDEQIRLAPQLVANAHAKIFHDYNVYQYFDTTTMKFSWKGPNNDLPPIYCVEALQAAMDRTFDFHKNNWNQWLPGEAVHFITQLVADDRAHVLPPNDNPQSGLEVSLIVQNIIDNKDGLATKLIIQPVFLGAHWTVMFVDPKNRRIEYFNSHATVPAWVDRDMKTLQTTLNKVIPDTKQHYIIDDRSAHVQPDGVHCGLWAAYAAQQRVGDPDFHYRELLNPTQTKAKNPERYDANLANGKGANMLNFRKKILFEHIVPLIWEHALKGENQDLLPWIKNRVNLNARKGEPRITVDVRPGAVPVATPKQSSASKPTASGVKTDTSSKSIEEQKQFIDSTEPLLTSEKMTEYDNKYSSNEIYTLKVAVGSFLSNGHITDSYEETVLLAKYLLQKKDSQLHDRYKETVLKKLYTKLNRAA